MRPTRWGQPHRTAHRARGERDEHITVSKKNFIILEAMQCVGKQKITTTKKHKYNEEKVMQRQDLSRHEELHFLV